MQSHHLTANFAQWVGRLYGGQASVQDATGRGLDPGFPAKVLS